MFALFNLGWLKTCYFDWLRLVPAGQTESCLDPFLFIHKVAVGQERT